MFCAVNSDKPKLNLQFHFLQAHTSFLSSLILLKSNHHFKNEVEPKVPKDSTSQENLDEVYGGVYVGLKGKSDLGDNGGVLGGSKDPCYLSEEPEGQDSKSDLKASRSKCSVGDGSETSSIASNMRKCTFGEYIAEETHVPARQADRSKSSQSSKGPECSVFVISSADETPSDPNFSVQYVKKQRSSHGPQDSASDLDRIDVLSVTTFHQNDLACLTKHVLEPSLDSETRSTEEFEAANRSLIANLVLITAFILIYLFLAFLSNHSYYYGVFLFSCQKGAMPVLTTVNNFAMVKNVVVLYWKMCVKKVLNSLGREFD